MGIFQRISAIKSYNIWSYIMLKHILIAAAIIAVPAQALAFVYSPRIDGTAKYQTSGNPSESHLKSMVKSRAYNQASKECRRIGYNGTERKTMSYGYFRYHNIKGGKRVEVNYDFVCRKFGQS